MKFRLWCVLFGHDFRNTNKDIDSDGYIVYTIRLSNWCQNCGLSKQEVFK